MRGSSAELSTIKANLTERLQASNNKLSSVFEERDLLNASLMEITEELNRVQSLSRQSESHLWPLHTQCRGAPKSAMVKIKVDGGNLYSTKFYTLSTINKFVAKVTICGTSLPLHSN